MCKGKVVFRRASDEDKHKAGVSALEEKPRKIEVELSVFMHAPEDQRTDAPPSKADFIKILECERALFYMSRGIKMD